MVFPQFYLLPFLSLMSFAVAHPDKHVLEAASYAAPPAYSPPVYAPADESPKPYSYQYSVADDKYHINFQKQETQDAYGNVKGSFTIALPDGRIQTTTYTADDNHGFTAEVSYTGTAQYPAEPAGGYGYGGR